jgi:hypothetical protein
MNPALLLIASTRLVPLALVDVVIIVPCFALGLAIGWYLRRRAKTGEDFFLAGGGRSLCRGALLPGAEIACCHRFAPGRL